MEELSFVLRGFKRDRTHQLNDEGLDSVTLPVDDELSEDRGVGCSRGSSSDPPLGRALRTTKRGDDQHKREGTKGRSRRTM